MNHIKIYISILFLSIVTVSFGQGGEGNIWYFGAYAGLDFNSGSPVVLLDGALTTNEGCATICDANGNLLFYTDGSTVWNANHAVMSNGTGLMGNSSSTQSGVIVPKPGSPNIYYIFTVDDNIGSDGCRYSIVNMNLNGGLGNVIPTQKNILLFSPSSEKIAAVNHANGTDIWVITHPWNSNQFLAYLITPAGMVNPPVVSNAGSIYSGGSNNTRGYMKPSPTGDLIACAIEGMDKYELFNFNNASGTLSTFLISAPNFPDAYGVEFSPDGTKMYGSERWGNQVFQWDLSSGVPGTIAASQTLIYTLSTSYGGALQLAPDEKIYLARNYQGYLGVINDPNALGTLCNYVEPGVTLGGRTSKEGLPTFISSFFNVADFSYVNQCFGDSTLFTITDTTFLDSAYWNYGDISSGINNTSTDIEPGHIFTYPATFDVTLITYRYGIGDTITIPIVIHPFPDVFLGNDTSICTGSTIQLDAGNPGSTYSWSTFSANQVISVTPTDTTTYFVEVTQFNCTSYDTITIMPFDITSSFTYTPIICHADEVSINYTGNASPAAIYNWDFDGANIISGSNTGPYIINWSNAGDHTISLQITQGNCNSDLTSYVLNNPPALNVSISGNDILCYGDATGEVFLEVSGGDSIYSFNWSAGYSDQNLLNVTAGTYNVTVTYDVVCTATASFTVNQPASPVTSSVIGNDILCFGETSGIANLNVSGGTPPYNYLWSYNNSTDEDLYNLAAGYYTVTIHDNNNCSSTDGVLIEEPEQLDVLTSLDATICEGESITLYAFANGGTTPYTFYWEGIGTGDSISVSPVVETEYFVNAEDSNHCVSDKVSVTVSIFPEVTSLAYLSTDSICQGDTAKIYADFYGGNGGPYTGFIDDEEVTLPYSISPEATTTYTIEGFDNCGSPTVSSTITIIVMELPASNFNSNITEGCEPLEVTFSDNSYQAGQLYEWYFGDNGDFGYSVNPSPVHVFEYSGVYDINLTVTSAFGCVFSFRFPEMITVYKKPKADFYLEPDMVSILKPIVYFDNLSVDGDYYYWNFGDGSTLNTNATTVQHIYQDTGFFNVSLITESKDYCLDTAILNVQVYEESTFFAPNVFSPLSENEANRIFRPFISGIVPDQYHMLVYDRWGEKVFESFNYSHGWDGKIKNKEIGKSGTYTWIVIYRDETNKEFHEKGNILLLK